MEGQGRQRRVVARWIRAIARSGKYLLLLLGLYVASFGPVAAWTDISGPTALDDPIVVVNTPLAQSAMALDAAAILREYADACQRAFLRQDRITIYMDYASEPTLTVWQRLFGLPDLETPYRTHGGVI
jgi:hypothetical protein